MMTDPQNSTVAVAPSNDEQVHAILETLSKLAGLFAGDEIADATMSGMAPYVQTSMDVANGKIPGSFAIVTAKDAATMYLSHMRSEDATSHERTTAELIGTLMAQQSAIKANPAEAIRAALDIKNKEVLIAALQTLVSGTDVILSSVVDSHPEVIAVMMATGFTLFHQISQALPEGSGISTDLVIANQGVTNAMVSYNNAFAEPMSFTDMVSAATAVLKSNPEARGMIVGLVGLQVQRVASELLCFAESGWLVQKTYAEEIELSRARKPALEAAATRLIASFAPSLGMEGVNAADSAKHFVEATGALVASAKALQVGQRNYFQDSKAEERLQARALTFSDVASSEAAQRSTAIAKRKVSDAKNAKRLANASL
jgi:hypothetical protein